MSTDTYTRAWDRVATAVDLGALGIAYDGCHKMYLAMDEQQDAWFKGSDYEYIPVADLGSTQAVVDQLKTWFAQSCGLEFINAVRTTPDNPNEGFTTLIGQFELYDDEEDE